MASGPARCPSVNGAAPRRLANGNTDAITTHHERFIDAVFGREGEPPGFGVLTAELKDMAALDNLAAWPTSRCCRVVAGSDHRGLGARSRSTKLRQKGVWHPSRRPTGGCRSWLLPQKRNAPRHSRLESASRLEAWCPIRGQRENPIAEGLGPEKTRKGRGSSSWAATWSGCQGLEINQGCPRRPNGLVRAFPELPSLSC